MEPLEKYKQPHKDPFLEDIHERVELPKSYTQICCPNCNEDVPTEEINIHDKIGKCNSCQGVFSIEDQLKGLSTISQKIKQEILRPEGIEMFYYKDELELSYHQPVVWFEWIILILSTLFIMPGIVISIEEKVFMPFILLTIVPIIIGLIYAIRHKAKHRIYITIDDKELIVQRKPRKFIRDKSYYTRDIDQIYIKKRPDLGLWNIMMIVDEGEGQKHIKLTTASSASKAKFLEQEIESHLNIQDIVVPEED